MCEEISTLKGEERGNIENREFPLWMGQLKGDELKRDKRLAQFESITALALAYLENIGEG